MYVIAEIGSNYRHRFNSGDLDVAKIQVTQAKKAGCAAAKFQMFTNEELYGKKVNKPCFGLPRDWVKPIAEHCFLEKIDFMCSAFSADGVRFLDPYVKTHKIAFCERNDESILEAVADSGKPYLISGQNMVCVSQYPAAPFEYPIDELAEAVSDHTKGCELAVLYASIGCKVFEKHFNGCDFVMGTPDSHLSIDFNGMVEYVKMIKWAKGMFQAPAPRSSHERQKTPAGWFRPVP